MHANNFGANTVCWHRLPEGPREAAVTARRLPPDARCRVQSHTCLDDERREQGSDACQVKIWTGFFGVSSKRGVQSLIGGMQVDQHLHGVIELHRKANSPAGQRLARSAGV